MSPYYDDDYYNEPSEFEELIDELKKSLACAVKLEHQEEIERLRKENAELRDIKSRIKQMEMEHAEEMNRLKSAQHEASSKAKRARLAELLVENFTQGWGVENHGEKLAKCDKCDKNRRIHYKTPSGKDAQEQCSCDTQDVKYEPLPVECYAFTQRKTTYGGENYPRVTKYFTRIEPRDDDEYSSTTNIYNGEPFESVKKYGIIFLDYNKCQEFCDWLNRKEAIKK